MLKNLGATISQLINMADNSQNSDDAGQLGHNSIYCALPCSLIGHLSPRCLAAGRQRLKYGGLVSVQATLLGWWQHCLPVSSYALSLN